MSQPIVFVENLLSRQQFPLHSLGADEEAGIYPVERLARASRLDGNRWEPTTPNAPHSVTLTCDQIRAANMIALDRNTNLRGYTVSLQASDDGFSQSAITVFETTIPTIPGGRVDDLSGLMSEELAWLKRFPLDAHRYWRFHVTAMGADLVPRIGGLWLGRAWELSGPPDPPFADDDFQLSFTETPLETLWMAAGPPRRARLLRMLLRLEDDGDYDQARYHLTGHYGRRRPMWVIWSPDFAPERAALVVARPDELGFRYPEDWPYRVGEIQGIEHEPLLDGS